MQHTESAAHLTIQSFSGMLTHARTPAAAMRSSGPTCLVRTSTATYLAILGGAALWCLAIVLPPVFLSAGGEWSIVGSALYRPFHTVCHQLADRSFHILGEPLAVCIRCTSIYFGFLLGTILYVPAMSFRISFSDHRAILLWSVVPMCVDVILDATGLHASTPATRLITGSLFGLIVPFSIIPTAQAAVQELVSTSRFFSPSDIKKGSLHA